MRFAIVTDEHELAIWELACVRALSAVPGIERARLGDGELGFVLKLGRAPGPELGAAAEHGAWYYACGEGHTRTGTALCFWELYDGAPVTEAALCRVSGGGEPPDVLRHGAFRTDTGSWKANRTSVVRRVVPWAAEVAARIAERRPVAAPAGSRLPRGERGFPSRRAQLRVWMAAGLQRSAAWPTRLVSHANWNLGIVRRPVHELFEGGAEVQVEWLPPRMDSDLADPFVVSVAGRRHMFCEQVLFKRDAGVIAHIDLDAPGPAEPEVVLDLPVHASYPCVVEDGGEVYLVPETAQADEVVLYRADDFPRGWRRHAVLLDGVSALDPTVFRHAGRWWLLATDRAKGPNDHLCVWWAKELLGPWCAHQENPVKVDVRSSRPAGLPFVNGGELFRPAQDCSVRYGGRVVLNRITALSPEHFAEEPVAALPPDPSGGYPLGTHTVAAFDGMTVVDGHRRIKRAGPALWRPVGRRFGITGGAPPTPVAGPAAVSLPEVRRDSRDLVDRLSSPVPSGEEAGTAH